MASGQYQDTEWEKQNFSSGSTVGEYINSGAVNIYQDIYNSLIWDTFGGFLMRKTGLQISYIAKLQVPKGWLQKQLADLKRNSESRINYGTATTNKKPGIRLSAISSPLLSSFYRSRGYREDDVIAEGTFTRDVNLFANFPIISDFIKPDVFLTGKNIREKDWNFWALGGLFDDFLKTGKWKGISTNSKLTNLLNGFSSSKFSTFFKQFFPNGKGLAVQNEQHTSQVQTIQKSADMSAISMDGTTRKETFIFNRIQKEFQLTFITRRDNIYNENLFFLMDTSNDDNDDERMFKTDVKTYTEGMLQEKIDLFDTSKSLSEQPQGAIIKLFESRTDNSGFYGLDFKPNTTGNIDATSSGKLVSNKNKGIIPEKTYEYFKQQLSQKNSPSTLMQKISDGIDMGVEIISGLLYDIINNFIGMGANLFNFKKIRNGLSKYSTIQNALGIYQETSLESNDKESSKLKSYPFQQYFSEKAKMIYDKMWLYMLGRQKKWSKDLTDASNNNYSTGTSQYDDYIKFFIKNCHYYACYNYFGLWSYKSQSYTMVDYLLKSVTRTNVANTNLIQVTMVFHAPDEYLDYLVKRSMSQYGEAKDLSQKPQSTDGNGKANDKQLPTKTPKNPKKESGTTTTN